MLFAKPRCMVETVNDLDGRIVNFYRVVRDDEQCTRLLRLLDATLHSRQEWRAAREGIETEQDPVERARMWCVLVGQSFARQVTGWAFERATSFAVTRWRPFPRYVIAAQERLSTVQVEHHDWRAVLDAHDAPACFVYCDPPYPMEASLSHDGKYLYEMTQGDHRDLAARLLRWRGMAMLSSFDGHDLYDTLTANGWELRRRSRGISAKGIVRNDPDSVRPGRTEIVLRNPACVAACEQPARQ